MIRHLSTEFRLERLLPSLAGGIVTGIITITYATAFNALIFTGDLTAYLPVVVIWTLMGSAFQVVLTAWFSSLPCTISSIQDSSAVVLAMTAVMIMKTLPPTASGQEKFITVAVAVAICTILTGLFFLFLGQFKLGDLIRYLPYPVIGGFLAGSGLLLVLGGAAVMTEINVGLSDVPALFHPDLLWRWLPGMLYGVLLMVLLLRVRHFLTLPGALLAGIGIFYCILWLSGMSVADARTQGLLLETQTLTRQSGSVWQPLGWPGGANSLVLVNWEVIASQASSLVAVVLVILITLLLNATGIELGNGLTLDFNRELKASGIANLVSGLLGCMPGAHGLGNTSLVYKMGARSRMTAFVVAAVCLFAMVFGDTLVSFFPTPILGGLLMLLGFDFLLNWVYYTWFKLPLLSYLTILLIALVMVAVGVLQGVVLGLLLVILSFVIQYSRVRIVRHALSGSNYQSKVSRPRTEEQFLHQNGERIYILELQGYLFFGTANKLLDQVRQRIENAPPVDFILLDFRMVPDLDSSAALSFSRLKQLAQQQGIVLVFTQISPKIRRLLDKDLFSVLEPGVWQIFSDLDHGLEWCEDQLLASVPQTEPATLMAELRQSLPPAITPEHLIAYFERIEVCAGECIIRQGVPSPGLYFIESGLATVQLECGPHTQVRLRTLRPGTIVGEMGLYLGGDTSAAVYANQATTLFHLSPAKLKEMEECAPDIAAAFHKLIARNMGEKLRDTTESLRVMVAA